MDVLRLVVSPVGEEYESHDDEPVRLVRDHSSVLGGPSDGQARTGYSRGEDTKSLGM